jgi:hypothetical protein
MARAWFVTTLLSSYFLICATAAQAQEYNASLDFKEPLHASVQATLIVPDGKLFTHGHAGGYEWSDYIKSLHVYRKNGAEIALQSLGRGQWALNTPLSNERNQSIRLSSLCTSWSSKTTVACKYSASDSRYSVDNCSRVPTDILLGQPTQVSLLVFKSEFS